MTDPSARPIVITPDQRAEAPAQQSPGLRRQHAFASDDRWVGHVRSEPGDWSGWHSHGDRDTYLYVLHGNLQFEYGTDGATVDVRPDDFVHVPSRLVHRERTKTGETAEIILVQIGPGPMVINVDGPQG